MPGSRRPLDGPWDQVGMAGGALAFLKGDQMVTVACRPAAVETGVALKVAAKTLAMLAKH